MRLISVIDSSDTLELPSAVDIQIGRFDLTKAQRTTDGTMQMQYIATKRRLDVTWKMLTASQVEAILDWLADHKPFFIVEYEDANGTQQFTAYAGDIKYSPWYKKGNTRYFESFTVAFIER